MLVAKKNRQLVLNLKNPDRVLSVIPTARTIQYKGRSLVAVPHRPDEVKVLNNLGFSAPAPIQHYYTWPGRFTPFKHQKHTAEFLNQHRRAFCLNGMGCVDAETEYLSPTGWKRIAEYQEGEVAQWNNGKCEFVTPSEFIKLPCADMLHIKTKYGIDQMLSDEHRVLIEAKEANGKFEVVTAAELKQRHDAWVSGEKIKRSLSRVGYSRCAIPVTFDAPERAGLDLTDEQLRVMVAVIADGHFPKSARKGRCHIRVKRERKKIRTRELLTAAGIEFVERQRDYPTAKGFSIFVFSAPRIDKVFTEYYWGANRAQLEVMCSEFMHWDGSVSDSKPTERFCSYVKASSDFVQYAYAATGRTARLLTSGKSNGIAYNVVVRDNGTPLMLASVGSDGTKYSVMSRKATADGFKYCFTVPSSFLILRRNGCIFVTGNSSKTLATLWAYDYLRSQGIVNKLLVVAPLSTLERTWADEIFGHLMHLEFVVLHGTREKRRKLLAMDADVYIINPDGLNAIIDLLATREDIDIVVVDEVAQAARNASTNRWKLLNTIINKQLPRWCWGLTGTPIPNAPTDAWAQCRLINPATVPPYFGRFRDLVMRQVTQFKWLPREGALDVVHEAMQPSIRYAREDCIDLPPTMYETRQVELTPEQKKLYKEMLNQLKTEYHGGEITAVNEAVKMSKLLQVVVGAAYDGEGNTIDIPTGPRTDVIKEILDEAEGKLLVFVPFTGALNKIAQTLASHLGRADAVEIVDGSVSKTKRDMVFQNFQKDVYPRVIVAHPGTLSHGLTLTAANTIVWAGATTSHDTYEQANARIVRPSQTRKTLIVHIEGSDVERRIYARLRTKGKVQNTLLDMLKES